MTQPNWWQRRPAERRPERTHRKRVQINSDLPCDLPGCSQRRRQLGRFCDQHRKRLEMYGCPRAKAGLSRAAWKPYVEAAAAFVEEQLTAGHPSVVAMVAWCDREIALCSRPLGRPSAGRDVDRAADYAARVRRVVARGLDGRELASRFVAAYLADDRGHDARPTFSSDEHFRHQAARLVMHRGLIGRLPWPRSRKDPASLPTLHTQYHDPCASTRRFVFDRFNRALGVVACHAADEIRRRQSQQHYERVL